MSNREIILTPKGLEKLEKELSFLKSSKRPQVAARIKAAISFGDITDNSEYEDAKNEQAFVEGRIATLEKMIRNARVIEDGQIDTTFVCIGSTVKLRDLETGEEFEYTIVGSAEADPSENKISNESPVGRAILGKNLGDTVEVNAPAGVLKYQIIEIKK